MEKDKLKQKKWMKILMKIYIKYLSSDKNYKNNWNNFNWKVKQINKLT
jgi:hypothetical protein